MTDHFIIALAQLNAHVGDLEGNVAKILDHRMQATVKGAHLLVTPELSVTGYPPEDLVLKAQFMAAVKQAVRRLALATGDGGPGLIVGAPWMDDWGQNKAPLRGKIFNAALLLDNGEIKAVRYKYDLPNYGVFDDARVFTPGPLPGPVSFRGLRLGLMVCEDFWTAEVSECLEESGAELLVSINASPYETSKTDVRLNLGVQRVTESGLAAIYVNMVGGQDELVFDGGSFALNPDCGLVAQLPSFEEHLAFTTWERDEEERWHCTQGHCEPGPEGDDAVYRALTLGLRDYVTKNGFPGVLIGMSGGIDSALSAAVAVDALGAERVHCVMMPSPYTSRESLEDAADCSKRLGVRLDEISIEPAMTAFGEMLAPLFAERQADTTEENIQARSRGLTLMALSNKLGHMVLSTGNKSEMSVGYATLYGDMCGGYNVLKDVYKTQVFRLARWRNNHRPPGALGPEGQVIPDRIITKPPTAELKPNQTDQDTLPSYDELDAILAGLIESEAGVGDLVAKGHDRAVVNRVWRMLENAEYKRRQAPPGVKITPKSFGRDRRYPITNAYKGPY
ncbi:NAD+ synthase [Limibacillus sp. MBR-115]|jgi:NAD+ synthase|uniref:NAD+ synthase n=1 Tax=Limibacillus sp. MBR-115 TaxID=3156465 RepID=UPI003392273E